MYPKYFTQNANAFRFLSARLYHSPTIRPFSLITTNYLDWLTLLWKKQWIRACTSFPFNSDHGSWWAALGPFEHQGLCSL